MRIQEELKGFIINWSIKILTAVQKTMQKMGKPEPKISDLDLRTIKSIIREGDTLLSYESWRFTSFFIPGQYKHAAIYLDDHVYEALDVGVRKVSLERFILTKDLIAICRPDFLPNLNLRAMAVDAEMLLGVGYDYLFSTHDTKAIYCSELCWHLYNVGHEVTTGKSTGITLRYRMGRVTIVPQDFYEMTRSREKKFILKGVFNGSY